MMTDIDRLILDNLPLVYSIAGKYSWADNYADIVQEGIIGMLLAARRYNPQAGVKFGTYAYNDIKGSIIRYIKREYKEQHYTLYDCDLVCSDDYDILDISKAMQLVYIEGYTQTEAAQILGISQGQLSKLLKIERQEYFDGK